MKNIFESKKKNQLELLLTEIEKISEYWITGLGSKFWQIAIMTEKEEIENFLDEWKEKSKKMIINFESAVRSISVEKFSARRLAEAFKTIEEKIGDLGCHYADKRQELTHSQKNYTEVCQEMAELEELVDIKNARIVKDTNDLKKIIVKEQAINKSLKKQKKSVESRLTESKKKIRKVNNDLLKKLKSEREKKEKISSLQAETNNKNIELQRERTITNQKTQEIVFLEKERDDLNQKIEKTAAELAANQQKLQAVQTEIKQLKGNKQGLESKPDYQKQEQKNNQQKKVIKKLKAEKKNWQQREQKLLTEIKLLKNPPAETNKENILIETEKYQAELKELAEKLTVEQVKTINLVWQEQKDKHNQQLAQLERTKNQYSIIKQRERERESKFIVFLSRAAYFRDNFLWGN